MNSSSESAFSESILAMKSQPISPYFIQPGKDFQQSKGQNGVDHYTTINPVNDLFTITWTFPKGSLHDDLLGTAFDLLEKSGTEQHTPTELGKQWYRLGVDTNFSVYENYTEMSLSGPSASYEAAVQLLYQWFTNMKVEQSVLDNLIADLKLSREDSIDDADSILHALARHSRFGNKSKYLIRSTNAELDKTTVAQLQKAVQELLNLPHQVSYIGKLSEDQWRKVIPEAKVTSKAPAILIRPTTKTSTPVEISFYHRDMAQARIWIESELTELSVDDIIMMKLFNEYFDGGMSGVVFQEIREARGLAYSAYGYLSWQRWAKDPFLALGNATCQADKVDETITKFLELFDHLPESEVRFKESHDAMMNRIRAERFDFRTKVSNIQSWQRSNVSFNVSQRGFEEIPKIQFKDMLVFHSKAIKGKPRRICIVGDRSRIDLNALKKIGVVRELNAEDIFTR